VSPAEITAYLDHDGDALPLFAGTAAPCRIDGVPQGKQARVGENVHSTGRIIKQKPPQNAEASWFNCGKTSGNADAAKPYSYIKSST